MSEGNGAAAPRRRCPLWSIMFPKNVNADVVGLALDYVNVAYGKTGTKGFCVFLFTSEVKAQEMALARKLQAADCISLRNREEAVATLTMLKSRGATHVAYDVRPIDEALFKAEPIEEAIGGIEDG